MTPDILKKHPQYWMQIEMDEVWLPAFSETATADLLEYRVFLTTKGGYAGFNVTGLCKTKNAAWREAVDTLRALADRIEREHLEQP